MDYIGQLEYDKIRLLVAEECHSQPGRLIAHALRPQRDIVTIQYRLDRCSETMELLGFGHSYSFENLTDLTEIFVEPFHGVLGYDEFQQVCSNVIAGNSLKSHEKELEPYKLTSVKIKNLIGLPHLEERYIRTFGPEGEVLDSASSNLRSLRKNKQKTRDTIMKILNKKLQDSASEKFIQEKIITQRDDRYVIPVKESAAPFVKGIVQGRSSSKSSIYLEPEEVVQSNNTLRLITEQEKQEIFKIMQEFTAEILEVKDTIIANTEILAEFDYYFAVCHYSKASKAKVPKIAEDPILELKEARHPLLIHKFGDYKKVIPFDLELGQEHGIVVLSGPNTGGKTVTMKAVGLLTMMALSGLPIPADKESVIGVFTGFYTDIGDGQSLENSLSTFSSHIENIKFMLKHAKSRSLVLIDEIGAATDPEQGSAIAQAVLEALARKHVKGIITTHYTSLKVFAEQDNDCLNASMQFDPDKHIPTYNFVPGLPGDSFAIEVAENLGMRPELIARAKKLAGTQNIEFTQILQKLEEQKKLYSRQTYEFELKTKLFEKKIEELNSNIEASEIEKKEIRKKSLKEAREYLITMQNELNNDLDEMRKMDKKERKTKSEATMQNVLKLQRDIKDEFEELDPLGRVKIKKPKIGQRIWLGNFETEAVVTAVQNKKVFVDMDGIAFTTDTSNIYTVTRKQITPENEVIVRKPSLDGKSITTELKLLGFTFADAQPVIDEFIDNALLGGLHKLRIVHGKGTGVLRNKVRYHLKRLKQVESIHTPPSDAGGDGVT
ncbi:MAG: Smr/MutS family protein, partial [Candidatus Zophobacter franzmannii]|nr:Smr/MutS family protein [Candidatus Zophobacter franzmannii]